MTYEPTPDQPIWSRMLKVVAICAGIVLAGVLVVIGGSYLGRSVSDALGPSEAGRAPVDVEPGLSVIVDIPSGSTGQDIGAILAAHGVVRSAAEFDVAVRNAEQAQNLQAGVYQLETLMDPNEVVAHLVSGPPPSVYRVTVIEGRRIVEVLTGLAESTPHSFSDFETALLDGSVSSSLAALDEESTLRDWEGLLFPDTYEFSLTATPAAILQRMSSTMEQRVASIDWSDWEELGYTPYEGIVLASLIETEVRVDDERPTVSSVIHNRLAEGMPLDIDATVLYALDTRDVSEFTRDIESPYNTYRVTGLPPTPISVVGRASLEAAAAPDDTPYFFYVLADTDGRHAFGRTLEEHNANVAQSRADGILP